MLEMPEAKTIARQMNQVLPGKTLKRFMRGNKTHKFLWLNKSDEEFECILPGLKVSQAGSFGRSIYLFLEEAMLWWYDTGGKLCFHAPGENRPKNYHLCWEFEDGSSLTFAMQMWGGVNLLDKSEFKEKPLHETGIEPLSVQFTIERFDQMLEAYPEKTSKGVKGFLVATGHVMPDHIAGLGNAIVQDILFRAEIHPKRKIINISQLERQNLYDAINTTIAEAVRLGGRYDETDLFGNQGGYMRLMDSRTQGTPCINCGTFINKITYLGGACYICPTCQT